MEIWEAWLAYISDRVTKIPGVTTEYGSWKSYEFVVPFDNTIHRALLVRACSL
jgi:hypothetical protein